MPAEVEVTEIKEIFERDYFLIPKGKIWYFLGGVVAFLGAVGWLNYKVALDTFESSRVQILVEEIEQLKIDAKNLKDAIRADSTEAHSILERLRARSAELLTLPDRVRTLDSTVIKKGSAVALKAHTGAYIGVTGPAEVNLNIGTNGNPRAKNAGNRTAHERFFIESHD